MSILAIGHRGSAGRAPENTLVGFRRALDVGAAGVELDVQLSRDGVAMVFHDEKLGRTAPGRSALGDRTLEELQALDAGSWFGPGFEGEIIPTLDEVLASIGEHCTINVELKPTGNGNALAAAVWKSVERAGLAKTILFSSFDWSILRQLRTLSASARIGILCAKSVVATSAFEVAEDLDAEALNPPVAAVSAALVARARGYGLGLWIWTVNDPGPIDRLIDLHLRVARADPAGSTDFAIISDFPELVVDRLRAHGVTQRDSMKPR